jgi:hypothetical protein
VRDTDAAVVVGKLHRIVQNASSAWTRGERWAKGRSVDGLSFGLVDAWADEYDALVETLLQKHGWHEKYSEEFVRKALDAMIARAVCSSHTGGLAEEVKKLVEGYDGFSQEQVVYVPLAGIHLGVDSVSIGRVELKTMTGQMIQPIGDAIAHVIDEGPSAQDVKPGAKERCGRTIRELRGHVCAEYRVVAEPVRALELAVRDTRRAVELVRYAIPAVDEHSLHPKVGLYGEVLPRAVRPAVVLSSDHRRFYLSQRVVGPPMRLRLDAACLAKMRELGVFEASDLLRKPRNLLTDVEEAVLRGIHWMADAIDQVELEHALLSLMTCLETYLTPGGREPIGAAVAENVAVALAQSLGARKAIKRTVKKLYGKRSGLSHGGKESVLRSDVDTVLLLAGSMTVWMIQNRRRWRTRGELLSWLEDQRLGGAGDETASTNSAGTAKR